MEEFNRRIYVEDLEKCLRLSDTNDTAKVLRLIEHFLSIHGVDVKDAVFDTDLGRLRDDLVSTGIMQADQVDFSYPEIITLNIENNLPFLNVLINDLVLVQEKDEDLDFVAEIKIDRFTVTVIITAVYNI